MDSMMNAIRGIKLWQVVVLVIVLAGVIGGIYGGYALATRDKGTGLADNQQAVPVQRGTLTNAISVNGSLAYAEKAALTFGVKGTVGEVLVTEGQEVKEGQVLATLDATTRANLEKAVVQTSLALKSAEEEQEKVKAPSDLELAQAEANLINAKLSLQSAQKALDTLKAGATEKDLARAQSQLDSANISLENAQRDLQAVAKDWDAKTQAAQDALMADIEAYRTVFKKWLGIDLTQEEAVHDPATLLADWGADLEALFDLSLRFQGFADSWRAPVPTDDPATRWNELTIHAWLNYYFGSIVPTCEGQMLDSRTVCVQKEINDAWNVVQASMDSRDSVELQAAKAIASAESAVSTAQGKVESAQEALADLLAGPDPLEVDAKASQVRIAELTLAKAEAALAELQAGVDPLEVSLREMDVIAAQSALESARQQLEAATLRSPMNGVVLSVGVAPGDSVDAKTTVLVVADPSAIQVSGSVDEIDVLFVKTGAAATVTMDALSGQTLNGTVNSVSAQPTTQSGVVSYPITIRVNVPEGIQLVEGLSAVASVVICEEEGLLIPLQSVYGTYQQPLVRVLTGDSVEVRSVSLGNSDDFWTVVRSGLSEGERVVMDVSSSSSSGSTFFRMGQMGDFGAIGGMRGFTGGTGRVPGQR